MISLRRWRISDVFNLISQLPWKGGGSNFIWHNRGRSRSSKDCNITSCWSSAFSTSKYTCHAKINDSSLSRTFSNKLIVRLLLFWKDNGINEYSKERTRLLYLPYLPIERAYNTWKQLFDWKSYGYIEYYHTFSLLFELTRPQNQDLQSLLMLHIITVKLLVVRVWSIRLV